MLNIKEKLLYLLKIFNIIIFYFCFVFLISYILLLFNFYEKYPVLSIAVSQLALWLIGIYIFFKFKIKINIKKTTLNDFIFSFILFVSLFLLNLILEDFINDIFKEQLKDYYKFIETLFKGKNLTENLITIFFISISPAIIEEYIFRHYIFLYLKEKFGVFLSILISSLFFAFLHFIFPFFLIYVIVGIIFCLIYYYTDNLLLTIFFHFLNNFISYFFVRYDINLPSYPLIKFFVFIFFVLILFLFIKIKKKERNNERDKISITN